MRNIPDVTYAHWGDIHSEFILVAVAVVAVAVAVAEEAAISSVTAR
jgi:hypothetical protein